MDSSINVRCGSRYPVTGNWIQVNVYPQAVRIGMNYCFRINYHEFGTTAYQARRKRRALVIPFDQMFAGEERWIDPVECGT